MAYLWVKGTGRPAADFDQFQTILGEQGWALAATSFSADGSPILTVPQLSTSTDQESYNSSYPERSARVSLFYVPPATSSLQSAAVTPIGLQELIKQVQPGREQYVIGLIVFQSHWTVGNLYAL